MSATTEQKPKITAEQLQLALDAGHELAKIDVLLLNLPRIHQSHVEFGGALVETSSHEGTVLYEALLARKEELYEFLKDLG